MPLGAAGIEFLKPLAVRFYNETSSHCGTNSVVECDLAKVEVAGSNPVSRSQEPRRLLPGLFNVWRRTQVVRERSAKPLCIGSNPIGASPVDWIELTFTFFTEKFWIFGGCAGGGTLYRYRSGDFSLKIDGGHLY
jgi:hypothetical protein